MTPVLLATGVVLVTLALLVADVGGYLAARQQTAAAADAAALAAAPVTFRPFGAIGSPTREAALFAKANGAALVWCRCPVDRSWEPREVEVLVQRWVELILLGRRRIAMTSRAEFAPTQLVTGTSDPPVRSGSWRDPSPR